MDDIKFIAGGTIAYEVLVNSKIDPETQEQLNKLPKNVLSSVNYFLTTVAEEASGEVKNAAVEVGNEAKEVAKEAATEKLNGSN